MLPVRSLLALSRTFATHPLTRDARLAAWRRFATWIVKSRIGGDLVVPWIEGQRLAVRRGLSGITGNVYFGLQEFTSMMMTLHFLREGDIFIDGGANAGSYTVLAAGVCRARTWSFEPNAEVRAALERNIAINDLGALVTVMPVALGAADGEASFTTDRGPANRVATAEDTSQQIVPQRSLDSVLGADRPIMMKLDLEGGEEDTLRGATAVSDHLKVLSVEDVTPWMIDYFRDNGFEQVFYDPIARRLDREPNAFARVNGQWILSNALYVRDRAFVEQRLASAQPIRVLSRTI